MVQTNPRENPYLINITATLFIAASFLFSFGNTYRELVFLIATHVSITHIVQDIVMVTNTRSYKIQFHFGFLLQSQTLDRKQRICLGIANYNPPTFFTFLKNQKQKNISIQDGYSKNYKFQWDQISFHLNLNYTMQQIFFLDPCVISCKSIENGHYFLKTLLLCLEI